MKILFENLQCDIGPIGLAGLGPLLWVGPNMRAMPNGMYGMWYFGEHTKLCDYGFYGYGFRYSRFER